MKELPILFSRPMVQSYLKGMKSQTRRLFKYPGMPKDPDFVAHHICQDGGGNWIAWFGAEKPGLDWDTFTKQAYPKASGIRCRYGKPGDRLWVRETWQHAACIESSLEGYAYAADCTDLKEARDMSNITWRPSIHMPRVACRILLNVIDIRVERLHDITEADAIAEGIEIIGHNIHKQPIFKDYSGESLRGNGWSSAKRSYQSLWQSINGPGSWASNPWVFVISFPPFTSK